MFSKIKIKWKLSILYTIVFSLLLLVISVSIYYFSYVNFLRMERNLAVAKLNSFLKKPPWEKASILNRSRHLDEVYIFDIRNNKLIRDPYGIGKIRMNKEFEIKKYDGNYITFLKRLNFIIGYPITSAMRFLESLKNILITFFVVSIILVFGISYFLVQRALSPIKKINTEIKEVNVGNLSKRLKATENGDEINELCLNLNEMLDRIEDGFERQKQFTNDVSHELRTPITNFIGYVQLLKRWGYKDEKVLSESLEKLEKVSFEMKDLVESLLKLSRDIVVDDLRYVDLPFLVENLIKKYEKDHPDFEFSVIKKFDSKIKTSAKYLTMLLNIIIDNAIKYSAENKKVEIIINKNSLSVRDYGIGINNPDKIFDRFYREDETRSKSVPGFGIGLSIAKKIADALNIKIEVADKGDGSEFLLKFEVKK